MTNAHMLIDMPATNNVNTSVGEQQMYNLSQVVLLVSNTSPQVTLRIQSSASGQVAGADPSPFVITNQHRLHHHQFFAYMNSNFPFLSLTNTFWDDRENKTNITTQIDLGKYAAWVKTNAAILSKFPVALGHLSGPSCTWLTTGPSLPAR